MMIFCLIRCCRCLDSVGRDSWILFLFSSLNNVLYRIGVDSFRFLSMKYSSMYLHV